jgi:ParB-like chromosome segregation protein Spo0J
MKIEKVSIKDVKMNPDNPRIIKDEKFKKLVKSIKEFPEMLEVRPIVVDDDMIVLGGNMRLKASIEAGLKEVSIIKFKDISDDRKKEFIIKDNVGFGEWDYDMLSEWDTDQLIEWNLDMYVNGDVIEDESLDIDDESLDVGEDKKPDKPSLSDDNHSLFELLMLHTSKIRLMEILNRIRIENDYDKIEHSLIHLVDFYITNKK